MPKRNYGYEKRQKELKKQLKKGEKLQRKLDRTVIRRDGDETDPEAALDLPPPR